MTETLSTPITMRFSDNAINELKQRARKMSFEKNKDISYVDLIREAVEEVYNIKLPIVDSLFDFKEEFSSIDTFWTDEQKEEFENSKMGRIIKECIEKNDYSNFISNIQGKINELVLDYSIANKILRQTKGKNGKCEITKDISSSAYVVLRRGAVPDKIIEGERIYVPKFDIACYPTLVEDEISPTSIMLTLIGCSHAIKKEIDSNVISALKASAYSRNNEKPNVKGKLNVENIASLCKCVAQHGTTPSCILMHCSQYIDLQNIHGIKEVLDAPPLKVAMESRNYGTIMGVPIILSSRIHRNEMIICGSSQTLGVLYYPNSVSIKHSPDPRKLRNGFVVSTQIGICIVSDWAVAVFEVE